MALITHFMFCPIKFFGKFFVRSATADESIVGLATDFREGSWIFDDGFNECSDVLRHALTGASSALPT